MDMLSEHERAILDFEREWWRFKRTKERSIREHLAISPTRYQQILNALIDRPEALAYAPMLVGRLRRLREARRRIRFARRLAPEL